MESPIATLLVLAFLLPAGTVFVVAYRHALRTWLPMPIELPGAAVASRRAVLYRRDVGRRFHAAIIAIAFASVFIMGLLALAMMLTAIVASA